MAYVKLELQCPTKAAMVTSADPEPLWTLDDLLLELNSVEVHLGAINSVSSLFKKSGITSFSEVKKTEGSIKPFTMCILDDDDVDYESEDEITSYSLATGTRFTCDDVFLSDSEGSDDEMHVESTLSQLMEKKSIEEGILFELESKHLFIAKEQLRGKLSDLELFQKKESEKTSFALHLIEKQAEARREMDSRLDKQYQRRIAEVLDDHLSILQKNHEQRSKIERRIIDAALLEEAKRTEKALVEERLLQEKVKTEAKARLNALKQAEAHKAALEAERRAANVAAEIESARIRESASVDASKKESTELKGKENTKNIENFKKVDPITKRLGVKVVSSEAALKAESNRLTIYNEVEGNVNAFAQKDIDKHGRKLNKCIQQLGGTADSVRAKSHELVQLINDTTLPLPISIMIFAKKVVSVYEVFGGSYNESPFAYGLVILLVASQVPHVMDFILAEINKACIYTVPKHLQASNVDSQTNEFWKMMGYREKDGGKIESTDEYMIRFNYYMQLFAALIQTEIDGFKNPYGLKEGWAWLAMFLNELPANRYTAVALAAFLKIAGYALLRHYKSQFMKVLNVISTRFLPALKKHSNAQRIAQELEAYLLDKAYLLEPKGRSLKGSTLSKSMY